MSLKVLKTLRQGGLTSSNGKKITLRSNSLDSDDMDLVGRPAVKYSNHDDKAYVPEPELVHLGAGDTGYSSLIDFKPSGKTPFKAKRLSDGANSAASSSDGHKIRTNVQSGKNQYGKSAQSGPNISRPITNKQSNSILKKAKDQVPRKSSFFGINKPIVHKESSKKKKGKANKSGFPKFGSFFGSKAKPKDSDEISLNDIRDVDPEDEIRERGVVDMEFNRGDTVNSTEYKVGFLRAETEIPNLRGKNVKDLFAMGPNMFFHSVKTRDAISPSNRFNKSYKHGDVLDDDESDGPADETQLEDY